MKSSTFCNTNTSSGVLSKPFTILSAFSARNGKKAGNKSMQNAMNLIARRASELRIPLYCSGERNYITDLNDEMTEYLECNNLYPVRIEEFGTFAAKTITVITSDPAKADALIEGMPQDSLKKAGKGSFEICL